MLAPSLFQAPRLLLRPPCRADTPVIFSGIASDPEVTRLVGWPRHKTVQENEAFISSSEAEWARWPAGPLLITSRADGAIIGSTGLSFETSYRASTGFVLKRSAWGAGFASEALGAVVNIANALKVRRLYALCFVGHDRSVRVLERCGFVREGTLHKYLVFPNSGEPDPLDVYCYARVG